MNNSDFRKLLAIPTTGRTLHSNGRLTSSSSSSTTTFTHRQVASSAAATSGNAADKKQKKKRNFNTFHREKTETKDEDDLFDESQARLTEIMKNYRDRAAERRKGVGSTDEEIRQRLAGAYKAVPGNLFANSSLEEARRNEIQKSKYLGGDMEHTHLVKGLDFSLLNKVRTEILEHEVADKDDNDESKANLALSEGSKAANTKLAANICKVLFESKAPQRNDLFVRGRMAYVVELEDEEADVPSTLLRSVVDCPLDQSSENINADNLLINKLTQVLAYLRTDVKKRRKAADANELVKEATEIFEGLDEYDPVKERREKRGREEARKEAQKRTTSYFDSDGKERNRDDKERHREGKERERKREHQREKDEPSGVDANSTEEHLEKIKKRRMEQEDAYAELYPGGLGMLDAGGESDDEADYTQMDMGNRKGPVKRWDFETQDDYERYQSAREANPKAAYQFGVKTSGGRKTRKSTVAAKERKLDREMEKISKIWDNRSKTGGTESKVRY
ncbi:hypothetical protein GPALN_006510 [Globodera pallida]|nr:hypothetical protein GPALN_006510 [Globodera pallida]